MEGKPGNAGGDGKKKGFAPFASLEDLSDESPPDDKCRLTLPGIKEDQTPAGSGSGQRPSITPRIDISRASSSSHHDDSSPERELFAGVEGASGSKIGLGFSEEMAMELRSSTEELDFQDPEEEKKTRRKKLHHQQQAVTKYDLEAQSEKESQERKDSACSEGGLLLLGGRTSRLSSIGSVASGGSVASHVSGGSGVSGNSHLSAASRVSGQSHLSAVSNYSKASRCSSPHRMLLETSFCGPKPIPTVSLEAEYPPNESVEATLLARKTDITGAVLPPDESIKMPASSTNKAFTGKATLNVRSGSSKSGNLEVRTKPRSASERLSKPSGGTHSVQPRSSSARANLKQSRPKPKKDEDALVRIIPLHGSIDEPEDADQSDKEEEKTEETAADPDAFTPDYGIYIPLKGPIIDYSKTDEAKQTKPKLESTKSNKPEIEESDLVRFISLHGDDDEEIQREKTENAKKYSFRNGQNVQFKPWPDDSHANAQREKQVPKKPRSPEPTSKSSKPTTLNISSKNGRPAQSMTQLPREESKTPSPAASFARGVNLFRRSSDSYGSCKKSTLASGSSDRLKKDVRNKSMFSAFFKKNVKEIPPPTHQKRSAHEKTSIDPNITNVEFKFKHENVDSIIIPLHSPDSITEPLMKYDPEAISVVEETEVKPKKNVQKEYYEQKSPIMPLSENHISGKSIVIVDVSKEDRKEIVKDTPAVVAIPQPIAQEKTHSKKIERLELEDLEYEPRVRKSISHSSTKEIEEEKVVKVQKEETQSSENIIKPLESGVIVKKKEEVETVKIEKLQVEVVQDPIRIVKTSKTPMESLVISPSEEKPLLEEMISDRSQGDEVIKDETEERRSSESEVEQLPVEKPKEECDEERKGLFLQTDSVEEELPYVPTTLPQERSVAMPIIPIRQRMSEVKTCPVERPRSTTPIQPSNLEEYAATHDGTKPSQSEKMQITLPRTDSLGRSRSPGKPKPWMQFAEECLQSPKETRKGKTTKSPPPNTPPPLPPRSSGPSSQWVMFDEQPERRRTPRRITTLPLRQQQSSSSVVYSYVNPEECSCECHESQGKVISAQCLTDSEQCSYKKGSRTEKEKRYRT
ncbi:titin isoform X2 [Cimex lectularius]|uniref:Uncharacterized protein n=1 Tax=Cimex lectularius TaxID=79782 RepID=A0A8I6RDL2_CIMLE|nr:titin isoform X2 [Cimex lectularius]